MKKNNFKLIIAMLFLLVVTGIGFTLRYLKIPMRGLDSLLTFYTFLLTFFAMLAKHINF